MNILKEGECTYNVTLSCVLATIAATENHQALLNLTVYLQPKVSKMQRTCAVLSSVTCSALQYFFNICHKRHDFQKQFIEPKTVF